MEKYDSDSIFMRIALDYAWKFQTLTLPNPCVGALVVCNNTIIALQAHRKAGMPHAEVLACKEAFLYKIKHDEVAKNAILSYCKQKNIENKNPLESIANKLKDMQDSKEIHDFISTYHNKIFSDCEFFVTLEPCNHYGKTPPCALLLKTIKPKRIIIAKKDNTPNASGGINTLNEIMLTNNILHAEAHKLIFPFLQWQKNNSFMLFKIAHRLHGEYKDGIISNEDSRIFTHNMRCIADYIIISGATLRLDNPLLDTRFSLPFYNTGKQPKILILSKTMQENELTNYNIACKDVSIIRCVKEIPKNGFKIIEGGFTLLQTLLNDITLYDSVKIDCIMGYISPTCSIDKDIKHIAKSKQSRLNYTLAHTAILSNFWIGQAKQKNNNQKSQNNLDNMIYYLFYNENNN